MKKIFITALILIMALSLSACGNKPAAGEDNTGSEDSSTITNPVSESTAQNIYDQLGISFDIPDRAADVSYSIIDTGEDNGIAQAQFTLDGVSCYYRIVSAAGLEDISGMYYSWTTEEDCQINGSTGNLKYISGQQGVCFWYNGDSGLLYSISVESGASSEYLTGLAEYLYTPNQDLPANSENTSSDETGDTSAPTEPDADAQEDPAVSENTDGADTADSTADSTNENSIAATAQSLIGKAFEWGESGPDAFDNSGFVYYCLKENGISAGRTAVELYASGDAVSKEDLQPGDIVFFTYEDDGSPSYCGVYIGDGVFIAASNSDTPIGQVDMTESHYQQRYVGARRY